jgi:hypothetical protein
MATIKVRVQGEISTNLTPEVKLVCQNDKYDVEFEFDESWANSNFKTALFIYNGQLIAIPFDGNICKIPALYDTQLLHIGVKSNDVVGLHTTTPARVGYLLSANDLTSNKIPEPTKDVYDEIIALINKYIGQGGGGSGGTDEERVREIVAEETADLVAKDERDEFVKGGLTENEEEWTDEEKEKACETIGAVQQNYIDEKISVINLTLEQSGLLKKYKQPITQEYNERVTADGANVLDGSKAVIKKVVGSTVACRNLFNPDRTEQDAGAVSNTTQRVFEENKYFVGFTSNNYYYRDNVSNFLYNNGEISYKATNPANSAYGVGFAFFANEGEQYTVSYTAMNAKVSVAFYKADGTYVSNVETNTFTIPTGCNTFVVVFNPTDGNAVISVRNIQIEKGTTATEYQPYFTGLKSASFGGIESTNADGTETETLDFPKTETPLGTTIDFENKKITNYGVDLVLTGTENWLMRGQTFNDVNQFYAILLDDTKYNFGEGVCTDFDRMTALNDKVGFAIGSMNRALYLSVNKTQFTSIDDLKSWLAQRYASGNPVTIRYVSETLQKEESFTEGNEYTAYKGGTEKVLENDGAEFGSDNTLTQDYILVTEVK